MSSGLVLALLLVVSCVTPEECPTRSTHQAHTFTIEITECGDTIWLRDDRDEWELYKQGKIDASKYE